MSLRGAGARGSLLYLGATAIQGLSTIAVLPLLTRWLGPAEFGRVALALIAAQVLASVLALGVPAAVTRLAFDDQGRFDGSSMLRAVNLGLIVVAPLMGVALVTAPWWRSLLGDEATDHFARLVVAVAAGLASVQLCLAGLRASRRAVRFVAVVALSTLGAQLLAAVAAARSQSAAAFVAAYAAGLAIAAVFGLRLLDWKISVWPTAHFARRCLAVSGVPVVMHGLGVMLIAAGDRIVIDRVLGLEAVGRYHVAYVLGSVSIVAVAAVNNQWAVDAYATSAAEREEWLAASTARMLRFAAACAVATSAISPLALPMLAKADFRPDDLAIVVAVVAASAIPYVVYLSAVHVVFLAKRTRGLAAATLGAAAVNVVLNLLLVPSLELAGAAISTFISYVMWAVAVRAVADSHLVVSLPSVRACATLMAVTVSGAAAALLPREPGYAGLGVVVVAIAAVVGYRQLIRFSPPQVIPTERGASS